MASRSQKSCAHPSCPNLTITPKRFSLIHQAYEHQEKAFRNKQYENSRKDDFVYQFYKSKEWKKIREYRLTLDHNLC